jgi:tetratricopeptide (TPR) repeat protein
MKRFNRLHWGLSLLFLIGSACFIYSGCGGQQGSIRDAALIKRAEEGYKAGAYEETIADASAAIKLLPTDHAYFVRAMAYLAKGDLTKAFSDLNDSLSLNPNQVEALIQRAGIYRKLQAYDKAITDLTKAIQLDPVHATPQVFVQRGEVYTFQHTFSQALTDFNQALEQDRHNASAYLGRATLFRIQGQYEKAISDYDQALQSEPNMVRGYAGRGEAYFFHAQYFNAMTDYAKAIMLTSDPTELASLYTGRADTLFMQGIYEAAVADYTKAIELNRRIAEAYVGRGATFSTLNQFDKASADFNVAIKLAPTRAQTYVNRGDLYFLRGKYESAIADYTRALKLGMENETRQRQVQQQIEEVQNELQNNQHEAKSSLSLCTWFARAHFMRMARLNQTSDFNEWRQKYNDHTLTTFDNDGFKAWIDILRNYQPYQKKFIKQWSTLTPPLEAKAFWEKELNAVQQESIATDQMLVSYDTHDIQKFGIGLALWQDAAQSAQASDNAMLSVRALCGKR